MDWFTPIDLYCERTAVGFWNEPLNALSNLAFPLAALLGWIAAGKRGTRSGALLVLILLAALIGVGSFLFHTFANSWSELADVLPIWSFVALYIFVAIHMIGGVAPGRLMKIGLVVAAILTVVFLATTGGTPDAIPDGATPTPSLLNGSGQYAPALIALLVFAFISVRRRHPLSTWIIAATTAFSVSLVFRTVDPLLCAQWPSGTHFMWHLLNATMVGLLLQVLARATPVQPPALKN